MATYLEYMRAAMVHADYEWSEEDGEWYAHIPGLKGLWATGDTRAAAEKDLFSALDGWLQVNFRYAKIAVPTFDGVTLPEPPQKVA